ncbi:MAG: hypothetical protein JXD22_09010 [Sedimentisphaerales bacterium]|nr:hypothetical protein [Sedimentisphaerales bacterium]
MKDLILTLTVTCLCGVSLLHANPGENIARGKKYTLSPRPNYSHCTDPEDNLQLTDGVYTEGYFWTQKSTVGWSNSNPVIITIDLESTQPVGGISFNTAAGVAGVEWPGAIHILISDDGKSFSYLGNLIKLASDQEKTQAAGYQIHRFQTDTLKTHARYVCLLLTGLFLFVDEIEIYRGEEDFLHLPLKGTRVKNVKQFFDEIETARGVRRRLQKELATVCEALQPPAHNNQIEQELAAIEIEISRIERISPKGFRTIFPLNELHRRIFSVQAGIWRKNGFDSITIWQKNHWEMLSPTEPPLKGGAAIDIAMMSNEYRSAAFNISNAATEPREVRLSLKGLPGGLNPEYITVHEVPFTDTKSGIPIAAALPVATKIGDNFCLTIPQGMTRQVWLTFNPRDIPAGEYQGKIQFESVPATVPVRMKIYPFRFPDQPTLHLGGWDYTDQDQYYQVTPQNRTAFIQHLREHFVDSPWATNRVMPSGKYNEHGKMIQEPSTEYFWNWLERWPDAKKYLVFANVNNNFCDFEMGTPPFQQAVADWITWWVNQLKTKNIKPEQLGLLLVDEPHTHEQDKIIIEYARVIQKAEPKVVVWEDPIWADPENGTAELFEICDVLCPQTRMWIEHDGKFADFYIKHRKAGRNLWFYSCSGPGKLLDPYSYHRMQHWFCWQYGGQGSGFWAFGDSNGSSSWNEYLSNVGAYTPVFLDENSVTAGKHMEAIREGIEDFEYLRILQDKIANLENDHVNSNTIEQAKIFLDSAARRVTSCMTNGDKLYWKEPKDRSVADTVRIEILELLLKLEQAN